MYSWEVPGILKSCFRGQYSRLKKSQQFPGILGHQRRLLKITENFWENPRNLKNSPIPENSRVSFRTGGDVIYLQNWGFIEIVLYLQRKISSLKKVVCTKMSVQFFLYKTLYCYYILISFVMLMCLFVSIEDIHRVNLTTWRHFFMHVPCYWSLILS